MTKYRLDPRLLVQERPRRLSILAVRLVCVGLYYTSVTGELEEATQAYELWSKSYPHDAVPVANLGDLAAKLGQYDKAIVRTEEAMRIDPNVVVTYANLAADYLALNRPDEAKKLLVQAQERKLDGDYLHQEMYYQAFLQGNTAEMERQVSWAAGKPGAEDLLLSFQSDTEAYYGRLKSAQVFTRRAIGSAVRADSKETAAMWQANASLREAEFGNFANARHAATEALSLSSGRDVRLFAALTYARIGEGARSKTMIAELEKNYPSDTLMKVYWLPTLKGALELSTNNPAQALVFLEAALPYELGQPPLALQGNAAKARASYQDFFTLWKDADPDIPILKEAKAEYAKLQ